MYCWQNKHYFKCFCQVFPNNLNSNWIHLKNKEIICLGANTPGVQLVHMQKKKQGQELVIDAEKLYYPIILAAKVRTSKIED